MRDRYFIILCLVLLIKALLMGIFIHFDIIGLGPDEAQYWTWSHDLDWGYYSKPPGIAWQIWLGTQLFGNTELGVRAVSILIAAALSLGCYFLALACKTTRHTAFWAGIVMALCPLGLLSSLFAITDGGMVLCWTLASIVVATALANHTSPSYCLLGMILMVGALFKWPIYLFWLLPLIFIPFYRFLWSKNIFGGILISLLGLLPSVYWNSSHDWVTFRHVFATVAGEPSKTLFKGNFFDFLASQAALLSPLFFILLLLAFVFLFRRRKAVPPPLLFCGATSFLILALFLLMALFQKMQGNWCTFAYPTAIVFLSWYTLEKLPRGRLWMTISLVVSILLSLFAFAIPYLESHSIRIFREVPYRMNPFRHNLGWQNMGKALEQIGYDPSKEFLFGDKYQMTSLLSFYAPGQKRAYFLNLQGSRLNQFSFWPSMTQEQKGKTGYFVIAENIPHLTQDLDHTIANYKKTLQKYFRTVEFIKVVPLFESYGAMAKGALIFRCIDYNGQEPPKPHKW